MQQTLTVTLLQIVCLIPVVCRHANQISFSSVRLITLFCISSGHKLIYRKVGNKHNLKFLLLCEILMLQNRMNQALEKK